jgi:hypothetical protein
MGKRKGVAAPQHTEEQKIALAKQVCDLYESQWATIESVCKEVGIGESTFRLWAVQIEEIGEMYKKAKTKSEEHYFEERLKPKAMRSLERLIEGFEDKQEVEEDVVWQGIVVKDKETNVPLRKNKVTRSKVAPNPTSVIFGMKLAFPEKTKDGVDITTNGKDVGRGPLADLSIEDQADILRKLLKKNADT